MENDLIRREDVKRLFAILEETAWNGTFNYDNARIMLDAIPSVTPQEPRWIPVSERLPEAIKNVLVTSVGEYVYISRLVHGEWEYGGEVVAWMPLPEPYRAESKDYEYYTPYQELISFVSDWIEQFKADYETRLKADMVAMLTELQLEIEEKFNDRPFSYNHHQRTEFYRDIDEVIQQKINSLKENSDVC